MILSLSLSLSLLAQRPAQKGAVPFSVLDSKEVAVLSIFSFCFFFLDWGGWGGWGMGEYWLFPIETVPLLCASLAK